MRLPQALIPPPLRRPAPPGQNDRNGGRNGASTRDRAREAPADLVGWMDERTGGSGFLTGMLYRKVPKGTNWMYTLGSATLIAFTIQAVTGVFLAMYYTPSPTEAYESVVRITNDVWLGEFVRGMHLWGATVMVVLVFVHMARTFVFGAYKYPRELNWVIGVTLLILTLVMAFTGYLLRFDQRAFWATIVGVNINGTGPFIGPYLSDFLRAGPEFGATTLARFYAIHMLFVPAAIIALIGAHLYLVVKLGTTAPPWLRAERKPRSLREEKVSVSGGGAMRSESRGEP